MTSILPHKPKAQQALGLPRKIHVELTSRCNLACPMCVKHASGSCIDDQDLPFSDFLSLAPLLAHCQTLVLNGIGESLLYPDLEQCINFAAKQMPASGWIGFQTNGHLFEHKAARRMLAAGLNRLCLSLDHEEAAPGHGRGQQHNARRFFRSCQQALSQLGNCRFQAGVEIVLMASNIRHFADIVRFSGELGARFVIVSHIQPYAQNMAGECLFNPNTREAQSLFQKYEEQARSLGLSLADGVGRILTLARTREEKKLFDLLTEMYGEARAQETPLHLKNLVYWQHHQQPWWEEELARAVEVATGFGLQLTMPEMQAPSQRDCPFMRQDSLFISAQGNLHPCLAMVHDHQIFASGEQQKNVRRSFGCLRQAAPQQLWLSPDFIQFRQEASSYAYPHCRSCTLGPCTDITGDSYPFTNDCFGYTVPCGYCMWGLGALNCL